MADNLEFGVDLRLDVASIARSVSQISTQFEQILNANRKVTSSLGSVDAAAAKTFTRLKTGADQAVRSTRNFDNVAEELANDLKAVAATAAATEATLSRVGADPQLFAVARRELERVLQLQTKFEADFERVSKDGNLLRSYVSQFEQIRTPLSKSISNLNELLRSTARDRGAIQQAENLRLRSQLQEQADIRRAARGQFVAITQQETTLRNAEIRTQGQLQLQTDRRVARTRIEILRFTLNQVRQLERAIGAVFRGTAVLISGAYSRIEGSVARLGQVFRRSNRSLDDGLQGALTARERSIRRSFQRQSTDISVAVGRQSAQLDQLDRRLSTGVLGAVSGRSRLGALVGGGLAIGGGVALISKIKEGFQESVSLTESLNAVRQITGEAADEIISFSDNAVEALFLTQSAALKASVGFASFGKSAGLQGSELSDFSNTLTQLATDLASFRDTSVETAITSLTAALAGEAEPIRRNYSVLLNEATLQQRAFTEGITESVRQLEPQERVLAAYAEILAQTTDAQGDAARTSKDLANASRQLGAGIITLFASLANFVKPLATTIVNVLNPAIARLTTFIDGDVSPAMQVFRRALVGAAAGLTALLVAKTAAEAIRILGIALRFTLTPLGLLAVAAATLGAAIAVFTDRSQTFSEGIRGIVSATRELAGRGLQTAIAGLTALASLVETRVLPPLISLARQLAGPIRRGIEIAFGFIFNVAVPAVQALAEIVGDNLIPVLRAVAGFVTGRVVPALQTFAGVAFGVLSTVAQFLEPAINGFINLGEAIANAFQTGDLTGLLTGLAGVASGIGRVFANLGILLYEAIRPQVERAVGFIVTAFQNIDLESIGRKILEIVRLVGFVLGSIVSDPRFITALAAIAAAAVLLVANFVRGFAEGVASNIPELGGLLRDAVVAAFRVAFSDVGRLVTIVAAGIAAALAATAILGAFRSAGERGALGMARGFTTGLARGALNAPLVARALFGGDNALNQAFQKAGAKQAASFNNSFNQTLRDFSRLGIEPKAFVSGDASQFDVSRLRREFKEVEDTLGSAAVGARLFRERTREAFQGAAVAAGSASKFISRDFRGAFKQIRDGASITGTAVADGFRRMQAQGRLSGQALGGAVLAGFGSVIGGQQAAQGNTLVGLGGIVAASLAGLAVGGPAVAAAVAGVGAISFVLGRSKAAAEEAAAAIDGYADSVQNAFANANTVAEAQAAIAEDIVDSLLELDEIEKTLLGRAGFDASAFVDAALRGVGAVEAINEGFRGLDFAANFGDLDEGKNIIEALTRAYDGAQQGMRDAALRQEVLAGVFARSNRETAATEFAFDRVGIGVENLGGRVVEAAFSFDRVSGALSDLAGAAREAGDIAGGGASRFVRAFGSIGEAIAGFVSDLNLQRAFDFDLSAFLDSIQIGVDRNEFAFDRIGIAVGSLNQNLRETEKIKIDPLDVDGDDAPTRKIDLMSAAIQELNAQRTNALRAEIEGVRSRLDEATAAADEAREALTAFITGRYADTATAQVDNLIGDLGNIGSAIEEALLQGGVRGEAALRSAVGGFESQLAGIIQAGFDDGLRTQDEFRALLAPLFAAVGEETNDAASRILSTVDFEEGFTPAAAARLSETLNRVLGGNKLEVGVQGILDAQANQSAIQAQLDSLENQLNVDVVVTPSQVQQALTQAFNEAGVSLDLLPNIDGAAIAAAQQTGLAGTVSEFAAEQNVEQQNQININVNGTADPPTTAAEVNDRLNAAVTGFPLPTFSFGTRLATGRTVQPFGPQ